MTTTYREAVSTWMPRAQCRGVQNFTELPILSQLAACPGCPVRTECLTFGLEQVRETAHSGGFGRMVACVYGGESPRSLAELAQRSQP